jgi:hypothetical protein
VEEDGVDGAVFVQQLSTEKRTVMLPVLRMGVQGSVYQDSSNNMRQMQGTVLVETNLFDIYVLSSNILSIPLI